MEKKPSKIDPYMILDYYKDWDSYNTPVMMTLDSLENQPGEIEAEDERRLAYLWKKYQKSSK
ncbi:MAG: hypothetical protein ACFFA6_12780 [Promethearchaeota archaeon]